MAAKRKRNQKILLQYLQGKSMSDIHNSAGKLSVCRIHKIIKQEAYYLLKDTGQNIKSMSPLILREQYKEQLIKLLN